MLEYCRSVIQQIVSVLHCLTDEEYVYSAHNHSSIGAHIRHIYDHFNALIAVVDTGVADYSQRSRGSQLECDRLYASAQFNQLPAALNHLMLTLADKPNFRLIPETQALLAGQPFIATNLHRELLFVTSHAIHHLALIKNQCQPDHAIHHIEYLGYAPSTIQSLKSCNVHTDLATNP
ncbi:hypothetical protein DS2_01758 [Catenovulum agarivorans DS-2]|uniref:DinB family protein n=1 Tax=Catenovulum agarivorans DS-2 TaxID=1328313 RepID=W7QJ21_9ALTE|nr:DinB family protein [Catenovulum agarivorans]EWH11871.1 hypothetical protein DS2_01758 [Catenovulum agarivorans DS-2]